jgi:heptosyltransferase-2
VYPEATDFAISQGFVRAAIVPKMSVPDALFDEAAARLAHMRRPRYAFAIGSSVAEKSWGNEKFVALAKALIGRGASVLVLGGPGERTLAEGLFSAAAFGLEAEHVEVMCQPSVLKSAAALKTCDFCIGNDTGILNVAVAVDTPALGLFGKTKPLTHDPLMHAVSGMNMAEIGVDAVLHRLAEIGAPGFATVTEQTEQ